MQGLTVQEHAVEEKKNLKMYNTLHPAHWLAICLASLP